MPEPYKESVRKDMKEVGSPLEFWNYCVERRSRAQSLAAKNAFQLYGSNPRTELTGEDEDVSNL